MDARARYQQVARLHIECIDQGFLPQLGEAFLALMYQAIDESRDGVLLVELENSCVVGFVSGCMRMRSIYSRMLRHPIRLVCALGPSLARPRRIKRIVEILRYGGSDTAASQLPAAELLSIAVDGSFRGQGYASKLYHRLESRFSSLGVTAFKITVGESLLPAHKFYRRMGAVSAAETQVHAGERSTVYVQQTSRRLCADEV